MSGYHEAVEGVIYHALPGSRVELFAESVIEKRKGFAPYSEVWCVFNGYAMKVPEGMTGDQLAQALMNRGAR